MSGSCCRCHLLQRFKYYPWKKILETHQRYIASDATYDDLTKVKKDEEMSVVQRAKSKLSKTRSRRKPTTRVTSQKVGRSLYIICFISFYVCKI